jgi:hypothetical protein
MAHDIVDRIRDDTRRWLAAGSVHPADAQTSEIIRRLQDRRGPGVVARSFPTIATFGD